MKHFFTLILSLLSLVNYSQSLVIDGGVIYIQEGGLLYLGDSTASAIQRIDSTGGILMQGKNSTFEWKISDTDVGSFTVPFIDTAGTYLPVSLKFLNNTPITTVKFSTWYDVDTSQVDPIVSITTHPQALNQFWRIEGLNKPTEITLHYNQIDVDSNKAKNPMFDESLLVTIRWNTDLSTWYDKEYDTLVINVDTDSNFVKFKVKDPDDFFTFWALQENGAIGLPIKLIFFKSDCQKNVVNWVTGTEINNDYFVLEGSNNGFMWSKIESVSGMGNKSTETFYEVDISENLWSYYRLKQVDFDGTSTYSNIITGCNSSKDIEIRLFPNPNDGRFLITHDSEYTFEIYDILGKMVWNNISNEINFDLRSLNLGEYIVKMYNSERNMNLKFVKIQ
jgi:hypothetical protein